ncbi:hypothetical protein BGZ74_002605 [Mortierella antarctica]|nr:hypothetical protein BGZ74_002605 [Mortierella antarctica]
MTRLNPGPPSQSSGSPYTSKTTRPSPAPSGSGSGSTTMVTPKSESSQSNLGLYIGLPIGLIVLVGLVVFGIVYKRRRKKRQANAESVGDVESRD